MNPLAWVTTRTPGGTMIFTVVISPRTSTSVTPGCSTARVMSRSVSDMMAHTSRKRGGCQIPRRLVFDMIETTRPSSSG